jgi:signal transduction histidine kinase
MRRWRADLGLVGIAVALGAMFFADSLVADSPTDNPPPLLDLAIGVAGCLALLFWRDRWPVWIAAALIPTIAFSASAMGATGLAMFAVSRYRSRRVTALVVGVHAVLITTLFLVATVGAAQFWQSTLTVLAIDAAFVASGLLVRSHRLLVASLEARASEAEEGQRLRVEEARHLERERIAREMHDVLAHRISLLAVHAGALEVRRSAPAAERQAAGVIRESAYAALEDLREVIGLLRDDPEPDRPQPTLADLPALLEQSRRAGTRISCDDLLSAAAPGPIGRHVYRVVQEGLTNARKHAPHAPVQIRLTGPAPGLSVEITNPLPLPGAEPALPGAGSGLVGLRERMDLVGGRLEHGPTPDGEFRLYAWLPCRD